MTGFRGLMNLPGNSGNAGAAFTGTAITVVSPAPTYAIPAGAMLVGQKWKVEAAGVFTDSASATTLVATISIGALTFASTAATLVASLTGAPWWVEFIFHVRGVGASGSGGSVFGMGKLWMPASLTQFQAPYAIPSTAPAAQNIDTTVSNNVTLSFTSSVAQSYTCQAFSVENLGATVA